MGGRGVSESWIKELIAMFPFLRRKLKVLRSKELRRKRV